MASPINDLTVPAPSRLKPLDLILVAVVVLAAFMPTLHGKFVPVDDYDMLLGPAQMREPTWQGFAAYWTTPMYHIYMPLTLTVWQVISHFAYQPANPNTVYQFVPMPFKIVSLALHAGSAVAATWVLSLLTRSRWPAIVGGLLFALHPIQVEAVCWTTGMKDLLCGFFALLAIGFYVLWVRQQRQLPWRSWYWYASWVTVVLSMCSKPTGMMLPVVLAALDIALRRVRPVRRIQSLWPFVLPAAGCAAIILSSQGNPPTVVSLPLWQRPLLAGDTFTFYLYKILIPFHFNEDYGRRPQIVGESGQIWWTWLISAAVLVALLLWKNRLALLAAALFIIPILPVSGIVRFDMQQYSTPTDHYVYQSMLGIGLIVAIALRSWRLWLHSIAVMVLVVLAVLSWQSAKLWQSPMKLYSYFYKLNPDSWFLGTVLSSLYSLNGDMAFSLQLADRAIALNPNYNSSYASRSETLLRIGRYREAADDMVQALKLGNQNTELAQKLMKCGAVLDDRKMAYEGARAWLLMEPGNPQALHVIEQIRQAQMADRAATQPATQREAGHE